MSGTELEAAFIDRSSLVSVGYVQNIVLTIWELGRIHISWKMKLLDNTLTRLISVLVSHKNKFKFFFFFLLSSQTVRGFEYEN